MTWDPSLLDGIEGWLTEAQARRLHDAAAAAGPGAIVEIGAFRGRSTRVLAAAAGRVVAIDPHAGGDRGPQEIAPDTTRGDADHAAFSRNVAGLPVQHLRKFSHAALGDVAEPIALLFVDGAHRLGPARFDLARWGARVRPGGALLVHDAWSSVGVTLALLATCAPSRRWRYAGRTGSLAQYERLGRPLSPRAWAADVARQLSELPWFARNVAIKLAVLGRRPRLATRLGLEPGAPWPY